MSRRKIPDLFGKKSNAVEKYMDLIGSIVIVLDSNGDVSYINKSGCRLLGLGISQVTGKNWVKNFIPPESMGTVEKIREELMKADSGSALVRVNPILAADGTRKTVKWYNSVLKDSEGNLKYIFSSGEDITEARSYEKQLENSRKTLMRAEEIARVGNWVMDIETGKYECSDGFLRICGLDPADFGNDYDYQKAIDVTHPDDRERIKSIIEKTIREASDFEFENRIMTKDGEIRYVRSKGTYLKDEDGRAVKSMGTLLDITDIINQYDEIEYMNYHDSLTGLYNRRYFDESFDKVDQSGFYPISIIVADVNGLKMINDTDGHAEGDRILVRTAEILKSVCEEDDILARTGGDDFILIMPRTVGSQAELVMNDLHELFADESSDEKLSVSMGMSVKNNADTTKEEAVKEAEDNMYTSKLYEKASKRGDMLQLIMDALYERSSREEMHSERVSQYCMQMARTLRMPEHKVNELMALGLLHDIGKIAVKDSILNKPGRLDDEEWAEIKKHPETGFRLLNNAPGMLEASNYILSHHERWDGTGYPNGLASYQIPLQARIIAIADAYDAMRSKRPYKDPLPMEVAVQEIKKSAGKQFDPELAKVFVIEVLKQNW